MRGQEIAIQTRLAAGDTTKTKYSDWEVYEAINRAVRVIAEYDKNTMFRKRVTLTLSNGAVLLPDDYVSVRRIFSSMGKELLRTWNRALASEGYYIDGGSLYSSEGIVSMSYDYCPAPITGPSSAIDMPAQLVRPLAVFAGAMLTGDSAALAQGYSFFTGSTGGYGDSGAAEKEG